MSKILRAVGGGLLLLFALSALLFLYAVYRAPVFAAGESYTFYLGESSSARAVPSVSPFFDKLALGNVRGESVVYAGDRYEELKARYRAELLFSEEAGGIVNYYLRSPLLGNAAEVEGHAVNLHIAVGRGKTAAGTPVIFGGY